MKSKLKIGQEVFFLGIQMGKASSGFSCPLGHNRRLFIESCGESPDKYYVSLSKGGGRYGWVYTHEIRFQASTKEEIEQEIAEKRKQIEELETRLSYLLKTGLNDFNEEEYKAYRVLKVMGIEDIEKAREIVKIMDGD